MKKMKKILALISICVLFQPILKAQYKYEETLLLTGSDYLYSQTLDSTDTRFVASGYCNYLTKSYGKSILCVKWNNLSMGYDNVWVYSGPGARNEEGRHIMKTSDGGYLIVGSTNSYKVATDDDGYALKVNSSGTVEWMNVFGDAYSDAASTSCEDNDYYYVAGTSCETSGSTYKGFIYCFNKTTGATVWAKSYKCTSASYYQTYNSIIIGHDGNLVIGGYVLTPTHNAVCVKVNKSNGNIIWSYRYSTGITKLIVCNVAKGPNSSYILTGTRNYSSGYGDVMLINVADNGSVNWSKYYNGGNIEYGVQTTYQSNRYITEGLTKSFGSDDLYLMKTDTSGNFSWLRMYHNSSTTEGSIFLLGTRPLIDMGNTGFALISGQFDANSIWNSYLLSINNQGRTGCEFDSVFTTTTLSLTRTSMPDTLLNITAYDTTITKFNLTPPYDTICNPSSLAAKQLTKVSEQNSIFKDVLIYPNPTEGLINIYADPEFKATEIGIYDMKGNLIYKQSFISGSAVNLSDFGKGLFLIRISGQNNTITKRIVVE
jgi:hypothetical protein